MYKHGAPRKMPTREKWGHRRNMRQVCVKTGGSKVGPNVRFNDQFFERSEAVVMLIRDSELGLLCIAIYFRKGEANGGIGL